MTISEDTMLAEAFAQEYGRALPTRNEVCRRCRGNGTHWHSAFANGITADELADWDDDERDGLMSGRYDVRCEECDGANVVAVPDRTRMTLAERTWLDEWLRDEAEYHSMVAMERRMGA